MTRLDYQSDVLWLDGLKFRPWLDRPAKVESFRGSTAVESSAVFD
jgi:hypothetical protein